MTYIMRDSDKRLLENVRENLYAYAAYRPMNDEDCFRRLAYVLTYVLTHLERADLDGQETPATRA